MAELLMHELTVKPCVTLEGPLTVRTVGDIRPRILAALRQHPCVTVDADAATEIDLSFIQLMLSARKSAIAHGKILSLAHPATGVLHERLVQAGLLQTGLNSTAGGPPLADQAFWNKTEIGDGQNNSHR